MELKKKYLFFCSKLEGGGAEKHLVRILNEADFDQFEIHLALTRGNGSYEKDLDNRIITHYLASGQSSTLALVKSYMPLRKLVKVLKPELVMSVMDRQNIILSLLKKRNKFFPRTILCCQNAVSNSLSNSGIVGRVFKPRIDKLYNTNYSIIAISQGIKDELIRDFKIKIPIHLIYNAGFDSNKPHSSKDLIVKQDGVTALIAVGRLTTQKGFDVLLNAIYEIREREDFHLWLLGQGPDETLLKDMASKLKIEDRVSFLGFQPNPYPYFEKADIFVLSSRWEGFGNVITEAMSTGCAIVATDCNYGPSEIITHNQNGILVAVEDAQALATAIVNLIEDPTKQNELAENGYIRSDDFSPSKISKLYFDFFATKT